MQKFCNKSKSCCTLYECQFSKQKVVNVDPLKVRQNDDMYDDDEHGMCEKDLHTIIMMRKKKKREKSFVIFCCYFVLLFITDHAKLKYGLSWMNEN